MPERQLQCDPTTERRSDHGGAAKSAALHVALDEAREVADAIARARLLAAAETRKVGRIDAMTGCCRLEVESPLQVSRRAETVDEEHGRAAASMAGAKARVAPRGAHLKMRDEQAPGPLTQASAPLSGSPRNPWIPWGETAPGRLGRRRCKELPERVTQEVWGACRPVTSWPDRKVLTLRPLITVTAPGPIARQLPSCQTAAHRSSMPRRVAAGSACWADSTQRWPKVSKCGSTAVPATSPSASVGRRLNRFGQLARMSVWAHRAIAPAEDPASDAPSCQASTIAFQTLEECSTCTTRPGSPPTR